MLRSKSIGKTLALSIALVIFLQYNSYAQKIVYQKKENRYYHEYGISNAWCFECSLNISDLEGKGTKICTLQPTIGKRWPSGIYRSIEGPKIKIIAKSQKTVEIIVENAYINANRGDKIIIAVGGKEFIKQGGAFGSEDTWKNNEAEEIINLFKKENSAKMIFISSTGKKYIQNFSLVGFTKAWDYILRFTKGN